MVLVAIAAWITYENWDRISSISLTSVKDAVAHKMPALPSSNSVVYQWKDEHGKVHVSNTMPVNTKNVKVVEYENNLNVIAPTKIPEKKEVPKETPPPSSGINNPLNRYSTAIQDAKNVQKVMDKRNANLQKQLQ